MIHYQAIYHIFTKSFDIFAKLVTIDRNWHVSWWFWGEINELPNPAYPHQFSISNCTRSGRPNAVKRKAATTARNTAAARSGECWQRAALRA
jgi:hypothetical protein